ncbi:N-acetyllactosaminide beta-1,3-N-acetylglucosaminyltransferase 2-like [Erpetoichthys calabaricus]|uniref:Hexosyltransferase n=1 Tax=Erpetoichthys calabaricus TaxID=27687 RepID=A0A8C4RKE3_ERPCA|nr:N-acetyllactosaminide beta-1,3-N-acetylglucosaminyltransferase 2-like [Erpetoichthys calabaricus]
MSLVRKKILLWAVFAFGANIIVYTLITISKPSNDEPSLTKATKTIIPEGTFWKMSLDHSAYWNLLQHYLDRRYNPILKNASVGQLPGNVSYFLTRQSNLQNNVTCTQDSDIAMHIKDFSTLPEQVRDFMESMHCRNYTLLIDYPELCTKEAPDLLLAIKSQVPNFENRQAIRESWGKSGKVNNITIKAIFLMGRQDPSSGPFFPNLEGLLKLERDNYKDVLLWDFKDTFYNLTLKDVLFLEWFDKNCAGVRYVFKGDDDIFLNTESLAELVASHITGKESPDLFQGQVIYNASPLRNVKLKYFVPDSLYAGTYPPYVGGGGMVYTGDLARKLNRMTKRVVLFPIDDVYMGMCLQRLGVSPLEHTGFKTFDIAEDSRGNPCSYKNLIVVHRRTPKEMIRLWKQMHSMELNCS